MHSPPTRPETLAVRASTSIWNMPIGDGAQLVPAHIEASRQIGNFAEEEVIVLEPTAPLVDLLASHADWDPARDRCVPEPKTFVVDRVPIPPGFVTEPRLGMTDDNAAAILRPTAVPCTRAIPWCAVRTARPSPISASTMGISSRAVEWSPAGRVIDEFQTTWGMPFVQEDLAHP